MKTTRPQYYRSTAETPRLDEFLKVSGAALREQARMNQRLLDENVELMRKLSSARRQQELLAVATEASSRGLLAPKQILQKVSEWDRSGKPPEFYRERLLNRSGSGYAESGDGGTVKMSSEDQSSWVDPFSDIRTRLSAVL